MLPPGKRPEDKHGFEGQQLDLGARTQGSAVTDGSEVPAPFCVHFPTTAGATRLQRGVG